MTKTELIDQMAKDAGITKTSAKAALEALTAGIQQALKQKDGKITLTGFGTFSKVSRKKRSGVNPATGEKITIPARNAVKFQAGKALKEAVD